MTHDPEAHGPWETLVELLRDRAGLEIGYTFLLDGEQREAKRSFRALDQRARAIGATLARAGAQGQRAVLLYPPGLDYIDAFFGCLYAGVVAVPAYPPDPKRLQRTLPRLQAIVADSDASFILTTRAIQAMAPAIIAHAPELADKQWIAADACEPGIEAQWTPPPATRSTIAFLQYTSGSTGRPKGVIVTHGNILANEAMIQRGFQTRPGSVGVGWLPLYHDMGLIGNVLQPLYTGFAMTLMSPLDFLRRPLRWLQAISRYRATVSGGPNFAYDLCVAKIAPEERAALDLGSWEVAFSGAERVRPETLKRFIEAFGPRGFRWQAFYPCYGLAEATLFVTGRKDAVPVVREFRASALEAGRAEDEFIPSTGQALVGVGATLLGAAPLIVDPEARTRLPDGTLGEIWVSGPHVATGYWNRLEESEATFRAQLAVDPPGSDGERYLRTGDLGFLREGELYITGRQKDLIILRGRNLFPEDIERVVETSHRGVRTGCMAAFSIAPRGEELLVIAVEVAREAEAQLDDIERAIRSAVASTLDAQVHAVALLRAGTIPKTSSGKIQRHACRAGFEAGELDVLATSAAGEPAVAEAPQDDARAPAQGIDGERLCAVVARALGRPRDRVTPSMSAAELGVDSLGAVELAHEVERRLGVHVTSAAFLRDVSLAALAEELAAQAASGYAGPAVLDPSRDAGGSPVVSHNQASLLFLQELEPSSTAYHVCAAFRITSQVDATSLEAAFTSLVRRHAVLRTRYVRSTQHAGAGFVPVTDDLPRFDFRVVEAPHPAGAETRTRIAADALRPFDLDAGPVLRVGLFRHGAGLSTLSVTVHHVAVDYWSLVLLMEELAVLYLAAVAGTEPALPAVSASYAAFTAWQQALLDGAPGERLARFWTSEIAEAPAALELGDTARRTRAGRGGIATFALDRALTAAIKRAAEDAGVTPYTVLLAGFQMLLSRHAGRERFVIGTPVAGRTHHALDRTVGYFVNLLPIRADLSGAPTVRALLARIRDTLVRALEHQDYPFARIVERLGVERSAGQVPLVEAAFVFEKPHQKGHEALSAVVFGQPGARASVGGMTLEPVPLAQRAAMATSPQFGLLLQVFDGGEEMMGQLSYDADRFTEDTVRRMCGHFEAVLRALTGDPAQPVSAISLLGAAERTQVVEAWNATAEDYGYQGGLHVLVEAQAARTPEAVAVVFEDAQLSYAELDGWANRVARELRARGVALDVPVGVFMTRSLELVVALLAIEKAGGAYVPLEPTYPAMRNAYMVRDTRARLILTQPAWRASAPSEADVEVLVLDRALGAAQASSALGVRVPADALSYILFTSGSTGRPKGVMNTHGGICNRLHWMQQRYALDTRDVVLQKTPFTFDVSVWEFFWPLMTGARLVVARPEGHKDAGYLSELIALHGVTTLHFVPSMMEVFLREGDSPRCQAVRRVFCSGEALSPELVQRFMAALPAELHNLYGPTEAAVDVSFWACERDGAGAIPPVIPIGRPVANTQLYVLDAALQPLPVGVAGELFIAGVQLARGYRGQPGLTAERFVASPFGAPGGRMYRTGDRARLRPDGAIEFLGRLDDQIKLRGVRIELGEIEAALEAIEGVRRAVAVVRDAASAQPRLVAYVVPLAEPVSPGVLRARLRERLPDAMVPTVFVTLPELPLTSSGKVDRKALPAPDAQAADHAFVSPRTSVEQALAGLWQDLLGVAQVGAHDDFFQLGGHSLLAAQLVARIRRTLGVDLPLTSLFTATTLEALARHVQGILDARVASGGRDAGPLTAPPLTASPPGGAIPLSFEQERLWFLQQLDPDSAAYNMAGAVRLEGALDRTALARALDELVQRHEALRTTIDAPLGRPRQIIADRRDVALDHVDLSHRTDRAAVLAQRMQREAQQPFDLSRGPLMRVSLVREAQDAHVLLVTLHHIIADGWSTSILVRELAALYEAFVTGRPSPLPALPVQFADYATWQRGWLSGALLDQHVQFWRSELDGIPAAIELPTDHPRPPAPTFRGSRYRFVVPRGLSQAVAELSQRRGVMKFNTLMAAFATLLHRYTGQQDIVVGTPVANRPEPELEALIGCFVNSLVLRTRFEDDPTVAALIDRVHRTSMAALEHQQAPFAHLVAALQPGRDTSLTPLFQVMFGLQNTPEARHALHGLSWAPLDVDDQTTSFDLSLMLDEQDGSFRATLDYSSDLFEPATMQRFARHWMALLEAMVQRPEAQVSQLVFLSDQERQQMAAWNSQRVSHGITGRIHDLVDEQIRATPDLTAVVYEDARLTYAELGRHANRVAAQLLRLGIRPEDRVAICLPTSIAAIVGALGILKAGGVVLPLDPAYPRERIELLLVESSARCVIGDASLRERLAASSLARVADLRVVEVEPLTSPCDARWDASPPTDVLPDNAAYLFYTSGSTGQPKGVLIPHAGIANELVAERLTYHLRPGDGVLMATSVAFDMSLSQIYPPLIQGATLVMARPMSTEDAGYLLRLIRDEQVVLASFVPSLLSVLMDDPAFDQCTGLQHVQACGEALSPDLVQRYQARAAGTLWNCYGPTEVSIGITIGEVPRPFHGTSVAIGPPIPNIQAYALDSQLQPLPLGVPGELYLSGAGLARGYLNLPGRTAESFLPDPFAREPGRRMYRTGDLARLRDDGSLECLGRVDNQVKVRGYRIELGEVEAVLGQHASVRESVAMAFDRGDGNKVLVAYVEPRERAIDLAELRRFLGSRLPSYVVPTRIIQVEAMPRTTSGKIDRRGLPAPTLGESERTYVAPRTAIETTLAQLWAALLGATRIGLEDDFFELGGHSLLATQLVSRVSSAFGIELPLRDLFETRTLDAFAREVERRIGLGQIVQPVITAAPRPAGGDAAVALSFGQERLWVLDQLDHSSAYNMPGAIRLSGTLDRAALQRALNEVIRRHEALRTIFENQGGRPRARIQPAVALALPVLDLRARIGREALALQQILETAEQPFDLATGPLLRGALIHIDDDEHVLVLVMHHIVSDGWSLAVFTREIAALYGAFSAGQPSPLPEPTLQYADYAAWQRTWLDQARVALQLEYWKRQLLGAPAALELPTDRPRPPRQSFRGAYLTRAFSKRLSDAVGELARREGATLFMTMLAAFQSLLSRYSGQDDIVVGTPIANRQQPAIEELIGFFVNTLAIRGDLSGDPTFREVIARMRDVTLGAYAHQDLPFERLVDELLPQRDLSRSPIFQVLFALQNTPWEPVVLRDIALSHVDVAARTAKFDLELSLVESEAGLLATYNYCTDLFDEQTIERMHGHLVNFLTAVAADPERTIASMPLIGRAERQTLLVDWNETAAAPSTQCVHRAWLARAAAQPDAVALVHGDRQLGYGELRARANQLAQHLRALGVGVDEPVALFMSRSFDMIVGLLGILQAGACCAPLDPAYPPQRLALILADSRARVVVTQEALAGLLPDGERQIVRLDRDAAALAARDAGDLDVPVGLENLIYLIYTSGSTGTPKGVAMTHAALANLMDWQARDSRLGIGGRTLQFSPLSFDVSFQEIFATLTGGGTLVLVDEETRRDVPALLRLIENQGVQRVFMPFVALRGIAEAARSGRLPGSLQEVITAGEQLQVIPAVAEMFAGLPGSVLVNQYGPSETHVVTSYTLAGPPADWPRLPPIGTPVANTRTYVLDSAMQPVPVGVSGELYLGGIHVARGYLHRPALTAERFVPDPFGPDPGARLYRTGDLARHRADGAIEFLGRVDRQTKIRGYRVELGEVEAALGTHPSIAQAAAVAREDASGAKRLVAYVVARPGLAIDVRAVTAFLAGSLPEYMVPSGFVVMHELPLTPSGKVAHKLLPPPDVARSEDDAYVAPRAGMEEHIAAIWRELLEIEAIGAHDNFFEFGGHSLLATQLMSRILRDLGLELPPRLVFEAPTIEALAARVAAALEQGGDASAEAPDASGGAAGRFVERQERTGDMPLAFAQERLWFLSQLESSAAYNLVGAFEMAGRLSVRALAQALDDMVHRHEVLRSAFPAVDGQAVQRIAPALTLPLPVVDVSGAADPRRAVAHELAEQASVPFDVTRGPLLRVRLVRVGDDRHVLVFVMHHIIADGWSMNILAREVAVLYDARLHDRAPALPALAIQFADYARWERDNLRGGRLDEHLAYWREALAGAPPAIELPTDRPRPARQTSAGAHHTFVIPVAVVDELRALSSDSGSTLFMTLLAAFQVLLARYTGQVDILVGSPVANRNRAEAEVLIGCFINTIVLRGRLDGNPRFRDFLDQVHETTLDAQAHRAAPFALIVAALDVPRDLSRSPLFQVMFALHNLGFEPFELSGVTITPVQEELPTSRFDLALDIRETPAGLDCSMEYNTDLFDAATIARLCTHFANVLDAVIAAPDRRVAEIPLMMPEATRRMLAQWNATAVEVDFGLAITARIAAQASRRPDATAIVWEGQQLSYGAMIERVRQLAHHLRAIGVGPERLVGICLERSIDMVVTVLAVLEAGGGYVPIDPAYPAERVAYMIEDSQLDVLVTQDALRASSPPHRARVVCLDDDDERAAIARQRTERLDTTVGPDDLAYVIYTSGSTGRPKGVQVTRRGLRNLIPGLAAELGVSEHDVLVSATSLAFDISMLELFITLTTGARLVVASRAVTSDGEALRALLRDSQATVFQATPASWRLLLEAGWSVADGKLRVAISGGEAMTEELARDLVERSSAVWNVYGPTETTIWSTGCLVDGTGRITIGRPLTNTQAYVLNERLEPVPVGVVGELYLGGAGVARGYLGRPGLTAERFLLDPLCDVPGARMYRTGDRARHLEDGRLEFLGRVDHQVKLRGHRIELGEIEACLAQHPAVRQAVVVVRPLQGTPQLVAYFSTQAGDAGPPALTAAGARDFLRDLLPDYMVPTAYVELAELPLTGSRKIDRRALPEPDSHGLERAYVAPRSRVERELAALWCEILGCDRVGVDDDFFDIGGHSLLAVRMMAAVRQRFGIELPVASLFQSSTLGRLAAAIEGQTTGAARGSLLIPLAVHDAHPPFFCVHPIGGDVVCYVGLARAIKPERPFYALRAPGLDPGTRPLASIEALAARYVEEVRAVRAHGPYVLGGWSFGGLVALEMARQLTAQGHQVSRVVMLDTHYPEPGESVDAGRALRMFLADLIGLHGNASKLPPEAARLSNGPDLEAAVRDLQRSGVLPAELELGDLHRRFAAFQAHLEAEQHHRPSAGAAALTLLRAAQPTSGDVAASWRSAGLGALAVHTVPGDHFTMLAPEHLPELGRVLGACLADHSSGQAVPPQEHQPAARKRTV